MSETAAGATSLFLQQEAANRPLTWQIAVTSWFDAEEGPNPLHFYGI